MLPSSGVASYQLSGTGARASTRSTSNDFIFSSLRSKARFSVPVFTGRVRIQPINEKIFSPFCKARIYFRATAKHTQGIAIDILSVRLFVRRLSVKRVDCD